MFKKLKEKITEEVKISPQRFAEFTQSVSDKLQSSSTTDDNFFSIGDDDANASGDNTSYGFSSVQLVSPTQEKSRKNSTSSLASDVSFLPRYEPSNMYHLQSDLDASASEVEDNASTASSQLGHLSKEQIYSAFQKSQMRYHKYRGRYTDLVKHYKDLERENNKMKSVLVETQDKAIRRVNELKEQCSLEQKAKAHLEAALRDDIDEKNYKIKTLLTQINLLQNDNASNKSASAEESSINSTENLDNLTKSLNESKKEIENLTAKILELKANAIVYQSKEQEYKIKITNLEREIAQFSEREKENNLNLAQNKMELHNEILLKDNEISNLKRDNDSLKQKLESLKLDNKTNNNQKTENLQNQNKKLIEKVESLTQKTNNLENELIKMETLKIEINNMKEKHNDLDTEIVDLKKLNEDLTKINTELEDTLKNEKNNNEMHVSQLREDAKKGLISLEPKIREKLQKEFNLREKELQKEFSAKVEELTSNNKSAGEMHLQLIEKDDNIKQLTDQLEELKNEFSKKCSSFNELEKNHLDLIEDCNQLRNTITNLEKDKQLLENYEEKIVRLEAHINTLQEELNQCSETDTELTNLKATLANVSDQLQKQNDKNKQLESETLKLKDLENNENLLKQQNLELRKTVDELNSEIVELKQHLIEEKEKYNDSIKNYGTLNQEMQEQIRLFELKEHSINLEKNENKLLEVKVKELEEELKSKMDNVERENVILINGLNSIREQFNSSGETMEKFKDSNLEFKLNLLKDMCTKKIQQYTDLSFDHSSLKEEILSKSQEMDKLHADITDINENLQSKKLLLEEKENSIYDITQKYQECLEKLKKLENSLSQEINCNAELETKLQNLEEQYRLIEIKQEVEGIEKSENNILLLKLQEAESQYQNLQQLYEEQLSTIHANTITIQNLSIENKELKESYENINKLRDKLEAQLTILEEDKQASIKEINLANENLIKEVNLANENLIKEINLANKNLIKEKDQKISKLSTNVEELSNIIENQKIEFTKLLSQTQQLDKEIEKIRLENTDIMKQQQEESAQITLKLQNELEKKHSEVVKLKQELSEKEKLFLEYESTVSSKEKELKQRADELTTKDQEIIDLKANRDQLTKQIGTLKVDLEQITNEVSQKSNINTILLHSESENESLTIENRKIKEEIAELNIRIQQLSLDNRNVMEENQALMQEREELKMALALLKEEQNGPDEQLKLDNLALSNTIEELTVKLNTLQEEHSKLSTERNLATNNESDIAKIQQDFYEIKEKCDNLFLENKNVKLEYSVLEEKCNTFGAAKEKLENQISDLESHYSDLLKEKQLLEDEIQELKTAPINVQNDFSRLDNLETLKIEKNFLNDTEKQLYIKELEILRDKLTKYKSLDLTNKSSIEFYENELQKLKNQNDKLNRRLDETLVTLSHCTELTMSTELEYLRNVLFNYMLGKESLVLARVIAAVCKFDPQQTELILQKEQQKQTLLGQLGII